MCKTGDPAVNPPPPRTLSTHPCHHPIPFPVHCNGEPDHIAVSRGCNHTVKRICATARGLTADPGPVPVSARPSDMLTEEDTLPLSSKQPKVGSGMAFEGQGEGGEGETRQGEGAEATGGG